MGIVFNQKCRMQTYKAAQSKRNPVSCQPKAQRLTKENIRFLEALGYKVITK